MIKNLFHFALCLCVFGSAVAADTGIQTVNLKDFGLKTAAKYGTPRVVKGRDPSLGGQPQSNAYTALANTLFTYDLKGQSQSLTGKVGIDDAVANRFTECAEVLIYGDNKRLWSSGPLKSGQPPVAMNVDLKGVKQLEVLTDFAGDLYDDAQVTFADMAISYSGFCPTPVYSKPKPDPAAVFVTPKGPETPRITGGRVFGVRPGSPFLFTVTASGKKPMTFSAQNLPDGLELDSQTGRITGRLKDKAEHRVMLSARNELGVAERELKIVVGDQLSLSPPMGWSSWNVLLKKVDQRGVEKAAELIVSLGLKDHGYLYVNIDDGWQGQRGGKDNALQANEKFPDMKGLCDKIHNLGLKAGIYHTPWMTSYGRFPGGTAATPDGKWSSERDKQVFQVGPYSFLNQDAKQFGEWGFDYCKWDWHYQKPNEIIQVAEALKQSGRDMHCGLSNRGVFENGGTYVKHANSWRTTNDLLGHWEHLQTIAFANDRWAQFGGPGHWLDLDSLISGFAWDKPCGITHDERYLQMSMWSLMSASLWMSCDLEKADEFMLRLLTNDDVLDINQDPLGKPARKKLVDGPFEVWVKDLEDGSKAVGFFNRGREPIEKTVDMKALGMGGKYLVRDLWKRADIGVVDQTVTVSPNPHGVVFYKFSSTE